MNDDITWEERTKNIMISSKNYTDSFKEWLLSKEHLGGNYFDSMLYRRCNHIQHKINNNDRDHFIVVSGKEGLGKSTLALQIASFLDPSFNLSRVCFKMYDFVNALRTAKTGQTFILDEGNMFLFSRESMGEGNRLMLKLFALLRQKNLCIIICVPNFWTLDSYVRDHRVDTLMWVHTKAKYNCYTGKAIKIISKEGHKFKRISGIRVPVNTFWSGYFNKGIPTLNDINHESYKEHKGEHFDEFLEDIVTIVEEREKKNTYISLREAKQIVPLHRDTIIKLIKDKKIEGKQVGGKWFVLRKNLLENGDIR